jgi:hypothetical protein
VEVAGEGGIVPKGDMQHILIKGGHNILAGGGEYCPCAKQMERVGDMPRRPQNETGPQSVHRAQGEEEQTFAPGMTVGAPCEKNLQQKTDKAVYQKIPKPNHKKLPSSFG